MKKTTLLLILDGWGMGADYPGNAIVQAPTPNWDKLWASAPHRCLDASGAAVGLPEGQMGNSEVGHLNIGAGRIVYQNLLRINRALAAPANTEAETLATKPALQKIFQRRKGRLHLMGLLSPGGVHSHEDHLFALCRLAAHHGINDFGVHVFLDGRDTPPKSAFASIHKLQQVLTELKAGRISSVSGRYYAMDRDRRWERARLAYAAILGTPNSPIATNPDEGLQAAYAAGTTDEFVKPMCIADAPSLGADDALISVNFRADRMRQLIQALAAPQFEPWQRTFVLTAEQILTMTPYDENLPLPCIFKSEQPSNVLGQVLAARGKTQLRLAETEKFAHVTYFFNGGREEPFAGEDRKLIPSLKVATYDLAPQMRAPEITDALCAAIRAGKHDFILCNYANGDMVGHSGKLDAAIKAARTLDLGLGRLITALDACTAQALITADHGNCEEMIAADGTPHTAHSLNPVPLVYYGPKRVRFNDAPNGLSALAPAILQLMDLPQPDTMRGQSPFASINGT